MDGKFVPMITFGTNVVSLVKHVSKLFIDTHLMIVNPDAHINAFAEAGSGRITVHQEACPHLYRTLSAIRKIGIKSGVCINPGTLVETVYPVLEVCDLVLIMTVNPGWGGQTFIPSSIGRIAALRNEIERQKLSTLIEVDGGINPETGLQCVRAGADVLVAGSYVFQHQDRTAAISALRGV
jgi:ribulose-phosphate 3-epimerase